MPDLSFEVIDATVPPFAAVPTLLFQVRLTNTPTSETIHTVALRSQLQIAVTRRTYTAAMQSRLRDVFDEPARWGSTLKNLLWTHISTIVPTFSGSTVIDLPVPCSYDFELVSTKYLNAVESGDIALLFLFSGTIFYVGADNQLQVAQISWSRESGYRLPVVLWQEMMARYYPNRAWLHLDKDLFDRLYEYKLRHALPTWEEAFSRLLQASEEGVQP